MMSETEMDNKFRQVLLSEIEKNKHDPFASFDLRKYLLEYKGLGMEHDRMLANLREMRCGLDDEAEDVLLELIDFVTGFCSPHLFVF